MEVGIPGTGYPGGGGVGIGGVRIQGGVSIPNGGVGIHGRSRYPGYILPLVLTPSDGCQNTYGWQAGGTHTNGMLSCYRSKWWME